jgi:hypothetical protein
MKSKNFCTTKEMVCKLKRPPQSGRKYLVAKHQAKEEREGNLKLECG